MEIEYIFLIIFGLILVLFEFFNLYLAITKRKVIRYFGGLNIFCKKPGLKYHYKNKNPSEYYARITEAVLIILFAIYLIITTKNLFF